jgi:hypothetical protein
MQIGDQNVTIFQDSTKQMKGLCFILVEGTTVRNTNRKEKVCKYKKDSSDI